MNGDRRTYDGGSRDQPVRAALGGKFLMLHVGAESRTVWQTVYDPTLVAIEPPAGVTLGGDQLSPGDIQLAVRTAYP